MSLHPAIFSRTYPIGRVTEALQAIRADGFLGAQMNLSSFGMESLPDQLDEAALTEGRTEAARLGLTLSALSGTYNMAYPDASERRAQRPRFVNVLRAARAIGAPVVTLCTGSRHPTDKWAAHPDNSSSRAWADLRAELDWALAEAASLDLVLAVEPEPGNVVRDALVARSLLDEVGSDHLKIILDAANLIGVGGLDRQADIIAEAIELLGPDVVLAHAKDIDPTGRVVAPGQGAIDLPAFVSALVTAGFEGALVGHGFEAEHTTLAARVLKNLCRIRP
ncbi:MAG: sugar phosphate isomerase/epimerase [Acidimicrobiia bacterium]|nr:sugar phosphate isomerase/epimerase [Acidimicrobiia bacterium]